MMYIYICETMPRKSVSKKTEQYPLLDDFQPDDLANVEPPRKKGTKKKDKDTLPPPTPTETSLVPAGPVTVERMGRFPAVKDFPFSTPIPIAVQPKVEEIGEIMRNVCRDNIDDEYYYCLLYTSDAADE